MPVSCTEMRRRIWSAATRSPLAERVTEPEDVERFDETGIIMSTSAGTLVITGEDLHIGKLSLDGGELHVDGSIHTLLYEDTAPGGQGGFLRRLFG